MGSESSINFLQLASSFLDETFYTKFKIAIDYKWQIVQKYIKIHAFLFFIYAMLVTIEVLENLPYRVDSPNYKYPGLLYAIMFFSIMAIVFELLQIKYNAFDYFSDVTNWIDIFGSPIVLAYCCYKVNYQYPWTREQEEYLQLLGSLGSFMVSLRLLFHFTAFSVKLR